MPPSGLALSSRYALEPWQRRAITAWAASRHPLRGLRHGIFDVFTGAGKTVLALAAMVDAASEVPDLKLAVVVPTAALMSQWVATIPKVLAGVTSADVGRSGGGHADGFSSHRFVVYVINSARERLARDVEGHRVMLVVDECHRAASEKNQAIFGAETVFRLGLSATAQRTDLVDEAGTPLPVALQPHGKALGPICFRLTFKDAIREGLLPPYEIHHHRLALTKAETVEYGALSRACADAERAFQATGARASYLAYVRNRVRGAKAPQAKAAGELQSAYLARKQWLYGVQERNRVAALVVVDAARRARAGGRTIRAMLFNERVGEADETDGDEPRAEETSRDDGAIALFEALRQGVASGALELGGAPPEAVALEHSGLAGRAREDAMRGFRDGTVRVLVSVKALTEGIDVPEADVGVSVASTSSARQRIQTLGRLLRAPRDANGKRLSAAALASEPPKELHLLYVGDTADEAIYVGKDWIEETGDAENRWFRWRLGAGEPTVDEAPPKPPASETEAWAAIASLPMPQPWRGAPRGERWSFRQDAIVRGEGGPAAENGAEVVRLLTAAAKRDGRDFRGAFLVTPELSIVLKALRDPAQTAATYLACGRLTAGLSVAAGATGGGEQAEAAAEPETSALELAERAFTAAASGEDAKVVAVARALEAEHPASHERRWVAILAARDPRPSAAVLDPRKPIATDVMDGAVAAFVRRDLALVRRCREELARRAEKKKGARGPLATYGRLLDLLLDSRM